MYNLYKRVQHVSECVEPINTDSASTQIVMAALFLSSILEQYCLSVLLQQYRVWIRKDDNIFAKYCKSGSPTEYQEVSKWVYFTKASWMIVLVVLQYLGECSGIVLLFNRSRSMNQWRIFADASSIVFDRTGFGFREAVTYSFCVYGAELLLFFPLNVYNALNVTLAVAALLELLLRRRAL